MLNMTHNTHSQSKRNIDEVLNLATTIMENVNMINYTQEEIKGHPAPEKLLTLGKSAQTRDTFF